MRHGTGRTAIALVALALSWMASLLACAAPAEAMSISGPTTVTLPSGCSRQVHYDILGGDGTQTFQYWVRFPAGDAYETHMDANGFMDTWTSQSGTGIITATDGSGDTATLSINLVRTTGLWALPPPEVGLQCGNSFHTYFAWTGQNYTFHEMELSADPNQQYGPLYLTQMTGNDGFWVWCDSYVPFCGVLKTQMAIPHYMDDYFGMLPLASSYYKPQVAYTATGAGYAFDPASPWAGMTPSEPEYPYPNPDELAAEAAQDPNGINPRGTLFGIGNANEDYGLVAVARQMASDSTSTAVPPPLYTSSNPECLNGNRGVWGTNYSACVMYDIEANAWCDRLPVITPCESAVNYFASRLDQNQTAPLYVIGDAWTPSPAKDGNVPAIDRTYGAPTEGQRAAIVQKFLNAGIDVGRYPTVSMRVADQTAATDGTYQTMPMFDGRNSPFCDIYSMVSSKLVAEAPYLLNGVYCGSQMTQGTKPAPAAALDPGVNTGPMGIMTPPPANQPSCPVGTAPSF